MYSILAALQMRFKTITTPSSEYLCNIHFRIFYSNIQGEHKNIS